MQKSGGGGGGGGGGGREDKVHYGLCENGYRQLKLERW